MSNLFSLTEWLEIASNIALEAGRVLKDCWGNLQDIQEKEIPGDLVTDADKKSEDLIIHALKRYFPTHQILAEESGYSTNESDFQWIVDPLDGTTNYTHQFPFVAISIGLVYRGESILGVIYNPIMNELFKGAKGLGATLNGKSIQVSKVSGINSSLLATGFPYDRRENRDNNFAEFYHLTLLSQGVRRLGSAALDLCYVAAGRLDGYWEKGLKPWDIAAGIIIVREAGGTVSNYDLGDIQLENGRILATNGQIHSSMSTELQKIKAKLMI